MGWTEDWGGFYRLEDIPGDLYLGHIGQVHHHTLEDPAAKGNPDQLARFQRHMLGNAVGKGARVGDGSIHRHFRKPHDVPRTTDRHLAQKLLKQIRGSASGLSSWGGTRRSLFLDPGSLALEPSQVIKLGPPHRTPAHDL